MIIYKCWSIALLVTFAAAIKVTVNNGVIETDPLSNCTFTINDTMIIAPTGVVPGIHYGLIIFECGIEKGYLLSKPKCINCGLYCPQNDLILKCQQVFIPFVLGFIISAALSFTVLLIILKYVPIVFLLMYNRYKKQKNEKSEIKLNKILTKIQENTQTLPDYLEIDTQPNLNANAPPLPPLNRRPSRYPSITSLVVGALAVQSHTVYSCDQTLFLQSNGQICDAFKCQDISTYSFNIQAGATICFNTPGNDLMSFEMVRSFTNIRYLMEYYTSDFDVKVDKVSNCKQTGLCFKEYCHAGSRHENFGNKSKIQGFDCDSEGLGCDFMCWHKYACTWYQWWMIPLGPKVPVYKKTTDYWSFNLKVTYKNKMQSYLFNTNNPTRDLDIGKLFSKNALPISITNVIKETVHMDKNLIIDNNTVYETNACDLNFVQDNKVGDFQISINSETWKYTSSSVRCKTSGCEVICMTPEPALKNFRSIKKPENYYKYRIIDNYQIELNIPTAISATISIGNIDFKNLYVEPSSCNIEVINSYGCTGCNKMPYIILKAYNVKTPGIMKYESNCSFTKNYISCTEDPYIFSPTMHYDYCSIHIPRINKTITFAINYEFVGELTSYNINYSDQASWLDMTNAIMNNPSFLDSITYSFATITGIGIVATIASKLIIRIIAGRKIEKEANDIKV